MTRTNIGLIALAFAIAFLAAALWRIGGQLPELNQNLGNLSELGDTLAEDVPAVVEVANRYEPHIDPILAEVAASRELAQQALTEASAYRSELPALMAQLEALDQQLTSLQSDLPEILTRVDQAIEESRGWRPITEQTVSEATAWRDALPGYLDRSEQLVASAREAGKEASEGMVSGFFSGALALPFQALGNVGSLVDPRSLSARKLTEEDKDNLRAASITLLRDPSLQQADWQSEESGHSGTVAITDTTSSDHGLCHTLEIRNQFISELSDTISRQLCQDSEGKWQINDR